MRRAGINRGSRSSRSVHGRKHNHCVIVPASTVATADALEGTEGSWFVHTNIASDLTVKVEQSSFHLHKLPMVSKSGYLNRLVFQRRNNQVANSSLNIQIDNLPGGCQIFQLVVKFCYGLAVDLTPINVAPLYCAAHFLEMSEDFEYGNLTSKAEAFLSFITFSSWKDTIQILKGCENVPLWAQELGIVKQCSGSIAWKACLDHQTIDRCVDEELYSDILTYNTENSIKKDDGNGQIDETWWFQDVSVLRIDHFVEVIKAIKVKVTKPRLVGGCIAYWTSKWLQNLKLQKDRNSKEVQRDTFERLIRVLPKEKNSVCCNFLLHLLKVGLVLKIDRELTVALERRVASILESSCARDLVVKNYKDGDTAYDVSLVILVVETYIKYFSTNAVSRMDLVARVVDEYLALVARDANLSIERFQLLAEALPENSRQCNDNLYRAIDMYLKAHPTLTEDERRTVCRVLEYHKLSHEARKHAMKNDRLPLSIVARWVLSEQINITKLMLSSDLNYRRWKPQDIMGVAEATDKRWFRPHKELQKMKTNIEKVKMKLSNLQNFSLELQGQVKIVLQM